MYIKKTFQFLQVCFTGGLTVKVEIEILLLTVRDTTNALCSFPKNVMQYKICIIQYS